MAQLTSREPVVAATKNLQHEVASDDVLTMGKATHMFGRYPFVS